jgi:hypothetical protein
MYTEINQCRSCGSSNLLDVFSLGELALTSRYPASTEEYTPAGPLNLIACNSCKLVQLRHDFDLGQLYGHDYGYRSGLNESMCAHLAEIVEHVTARTQLVAGDTVLDIGSNDATLLKCYQNSGLNRWGVDPSAEQFRAFYPDDIAALPRLFDADEFLDAAGDKAKIITSIAMFYDLPDPNSFVSGIARSLRMDGIWLLEQSYLPTMIKQNAYDTICHEHLEYYGLGPLSDLMQRHGLKVIDVSLNKTNGGSFQVFVSHDTAAKSVNPDVERLIAWEKAQGFDSIGPIHAFKRRVDELRRELRSFLCDIRRSGKSVFVYGASTKGNTLLQYCGIDHSIVEAAADRNPEKWGKYTPRTNIPIISEEEARQHKPDFFLVLPWHFKDGFLKREAGFLANGGHMIFPLPQLYVI